MDLLFLKMCGKGGTMDVLAFAEALAEVAARWCARTTPSRPPARGGPRPASCASCAVKRGGSYLCTLSGRYPELHAASPSDAIERLLDERGL